MSVHDFQSRGIQKRIIIEGDLVLTSPAHFGGGEDESASDMELALDPCENKPVIWGTSLAGALRAYLFEYLFGTIYDEKEYHTISSRADNIVNQLFGFQSGELGGQSWLLFSDAISNERCFESRDMVKIDPKTRTAKDKAKFDAQLIAVGTRFPLKLELWIPRNLPKNQQGIASFQEAVSIVLQGLEEGKICLGAKKNRGWGACRVEGWHVVSYDCDSIQGLIDWLSDKRPTDDEKKKIVQALGLERLPQEDKRDSCSIEARMHLISPLLIGSASGAANDPDTAQLSRKTVSQAEEWVVSGTALAGMLRSQCLRILKTIGFSDDQVDQFQNSLWGFVKEKVNNPRDEKARSSRVRVDEVVLSNIFTRVQARIRINHFTGGTFPGALFEESAVIPRCLDTTPAQKVENVVFRMEIKKPQLPEIGLLLLAFGDLCTQAANLGSGYGIGHGFLTLQSLILRWRSQGEDVTISRKTEGEKNGDLYDSEYELTCTDEERVRLYIQALMKVKEGGIHD